MGTLGRVVRQIGYFVSLLLLVGLSKSFLVGLAVGYAKSKATKHDNRVVERVWREQDLLGIKFETPTRLVEDKNEVKLPPELEELLVSYKGYTGQSRNTYLSISLLTYKEGVAYNLQMGARGAISEILAGFSKDEPEIVDDRFINGNVSGIVASGEKAIKGKNIYAKAFVFKHENKVYVVSTLTLGEDLNDDVFSRVSQSVSIL